MSNQHERENAFQAALGEDYQLLKFSYPHHDEFQASVADQITKHFNSSDASSIKVLEGGAGSGVTTSFLLAADHRVHVYAVDSAKAMLDQAASLLSDAEQRVQLIESDLLEYVRQQPDQSFDAFVTVWTLHNLQPKYREELFSQIRRILKAGGLFVSGDKYTVQDSAQHDQLLEMQLNRFREFPTNNQEIIQAWVEHNLEDESIRISEEEQHDSLKKLGFTEVATVYRRDMEAIIVGVAK